MPVSDQNVFILFIANVGLSSVQVRSAHKEKGDENDEKIAPICMPSYVLIILLTLADD